MPCSGRFPQLLLFICRAKMLVPIQPVRARGWWQDSFVRHNDRLEFLLSSRKRHGSSLCAFPGLALVNGILMHSTRHACLLSVNPPMIPGLDYKCPGVAVASGIAGDWHADCQPAGDSAPKLSTTQPPIHSHSLPIHQHHSFITASSTRSPPTARYYRGAMSPVPVSSM